MDTNIFSTTRREINDFMYNTIEVVPGYLFNQYDTIKRCHLYLNSRFEDNSLYQGREKLFFNIVKFRRDIAAKFLNIDTKDIRLWEMNPKSKWSTFLFEKELKLWMKQNKIGILLNDISVEAPSYGSAVVRKTKKGAKLQDLRRLFLDPTVERIRDSRFITVKHLLTTSELRKKVKDGWDADLIEGMIKDKEDELSNAGKSYETNGQVNQIVSSPYFEIYERFGEVPASWLDLKGEESMRSVFIMYEPLITTTQENGNIVENGSILFKSKWTKEYPFLDFHYSKTPGRWLGVGVVEDLFPAQERINELANQKRISMEISTIHLFQTTGKNIVNNILSDLQSGDLLEAGPDGEITPVANEERNLAAFASEEQNYDRLADRVSFANGQAGGEALPASTPATNAIIAQNNTTSFFGFKRENYGLFIQEFCNEFVLPQVYTELSDQHILRFTGTQEEIQQLDQAYLDVLTRDWIINTVLSSGKVPTSEEVAFKREVFAGGLKKQGGSRFVDVKEKLYEDIEFEFDIMVTSEQDNVATLAQNTFQLLTAVGQNPNLLVDPVSKALLYEYASKIGINPIKLENAEANRTQPPMNPNQMPQQEAQQQPGQAVRPQLTQPVA